jgi:hypothetical protein
MNKSICLLTINSGADGRSASFHVLMVKVV